MKIIGYPHIGGTWVTLLADHKRSGQFTFPGPCRVVKLTAYLDGNGAGLSGHALLRGVVYDGSGNLFGVGGEFAIEKAQEPMWFDLPMLGQQGGIPIPAAGTYDLGILSGGVDEVARLAAGAGTGRYNADTYADGPADPYGSVSTDSCLASIFATYINEPNFGARDELEFAQLPFQDAQEVYGATGGDRTTLRQAVCGWHGTTTDPEVGAVAVVNPNGVLADLVGERLQITLATVGKQRVVNVYCKTTATIADDEDLSLSRRAFLRLGLLSDFSLPVTVEVIP